MALHALSILYQGVVSEDNIYYAFTNLAWPEPVVSTLRSPHTRLYIQQLTHLVEANIKENIEGLYHLSE